MKVLVIRFRAIGDCVMAAWATTAIRQQYPDAWIAWAVESHCAPVLDREHLVQKVFHFPRDQWKRQRLSPKTWRDQIAHYLRLRKHGFDVAIDMHGHPKTALASRLSGAKIRIGTFAKDTLSGKLNGLPGPQPEGLHIVDQHLWGIRHWQDFQLPTKPLMPKIERDFGLGPKLVTICTGGSEHKKRFPHQAWEAIASGLSDAGWQVAVVGGPGDPVLSVGKNFVGELNLRSSIDLIAQSQLHIATDTGTGHIADAYGVPVISLFGCDDAWVNRFRPYGGFGKILRVDGHVSEIAPESVIEVATQYF